MANLLIGLAHPLNVQSHGVRLALGRLNNLADQEIGCMSGDRLHAEIVRSKRRPDKSI